MFKVAVCVLWLSIASVSCTPRKGGDAGLRSAAPSSEAQEEAGLKEGCGQVPVAKSMELKKNLVNGLKVWTTGFELSSRDGDGGVTSTGGVLGYMGEPPISVRRTFQFTDSERRLIAEGRESIFPLIKRFDVFACDKKTPIGRLERHVDDQVVKVASTFQTAAAASVWTPTPFGFVTMGAAAVLKTATAMRSVFLIIDAENRVVGVAKKRDALVTSFTVEEVIPGKESEPPATTWTIERGALQGGHFDNWKIKVSDESTIDSRLVLMLPAFKTDKDASLPGTYGM